MNRYIDALLWAISVIIQINDNITSHYWLVKKFLFCTQILWNISGLICLRVKVSILLLETIFITIHFVAISTVYFDKQILSSNILRVLHFKYSHLVHFRLELVVVVSFFFDTRDETGLVFTASILRTLK